MFSGDSKNPNPRAHRSSGKRGLPSFPLNSGPEVGIFMEPLNTNDRFFFLIYHDRTVPYCVIFVGDVTEIDVYNQ